MRGSPSTGIRAKESKSAPEVTHGPSANPHTRRRPRGQNSRETKTAGRVGGQKRRNRAGQGARPTQPGGDTPRPPGPRPGPGSASPITPPTGSPSSRLGPLWPAQERLACGLGASPPHGAPPVARGARDRSWAALARHGLSTALPRGAVAPGLLPPLGSLGNASGRFPGNAGRCR